jgi:hypothetical protein
MNELMKSPPIYYYVNEDGDYVDKNGNRIDEPKPFVYLVDVMVAAGLAKSKREARYFIEKGAVTMWIKKEENENSCNR